MVLVHVLITVSVVIVIVADVVVGVVVDVDVGVDVDVDVDVDVGRVLLMELPTINCLAQPSIELEPSRSSSSTRIYTRYDGSETDFTSSQLIFLHFT